MIKRFRFRNEVAVSPILVRAIPCEVLVPVKEKSPNPREYVEPFLHKACLDYVKFVEGYMGHRVQDWVADKRENFHLNCHVIVFARDERNIVSRFLTLFSKDQGGLYTPDPQQQRNHLQTTEGVDGLGKPVF